MPLNGMLSLRYSPAAIISAERSICARSFVGLRGAPRAAKALLQILRSIRKRNTEFAGCLQDSFIKHRRRYLGQVRRHLLVVCN